MSLYQQFKGTPVLYTRPSIGRPKQIGNATIRPDFFFSSHETEEEILVLRLLTAAAHTFSHTFSLARSFGRKHHILTSSLLLLPLCAPKLLPVGVEGRTFPLLPSCCFVVNAAARRLCLCSSQPSATTTLWLLRCYTCAVGCLEKAVMAGRLRQQL